MLFSALRLRYRLLRRSCSSRTPRSCASSPAASISPTNSRYAAWTRWTNKRRGTSSRSCTPYLEAAPIGWQLFILGSSQRDSTALPSFLDTYATRLLAQALSLVKVNRVWRKIGNGRHVIAFSSSRCTRCGVIRDGFVSYVARLAYAQQCQHPNR